MYYKKESGVEGEDIAYEFLASKGYSIVNRNFSCRFGEVDIIALDYSKKDMELVFVEVKSRRDTRCGNPAEAVDSRKMRHIIKVAEYYILTRHLEELNCRFDVIEVLFGKSVNHIKNAFDFSDAYERRKKC